MYCIGFNPDSLQFVNEFMMGHLVKCFRKVYEYYIRLKSQLNYCSKVMRNLEKLSYDRKTITKSVLFGVK